MPWRSTLYPSLSSPFRAALMALSREDAGCLTEIRVHVGRPVRWYFADGRCWTGELVEEKAMDELIGALCAHSRYAYETQMAQGFIPLEGGHRAGVCGRVVYENGEIVRMSAITSVCLRIAKGIPGASLPLRKLLFAQQRPARVLLLGPPGSGKTTILRDAALYLANACALRVAAADEREELFAGEAAADVDVLRGARKADAMTMLVRAMSPQVIVCDELGKTEDAQALLTAASCGVGVLASAHAERFEDIHRRPALVELYQKRAFDRYVLLAPVGRIAGVIDAEGKESKAGG